MKNEHTYVSLYMSICNFDIVSNRKGTTIYLLATIHAKRSIGKKKEEKYL